MKLYMGRFRLDSPFSYCNVDYHIARGVTRGICNDIIDIFVIGRIVGDCNFVYEWWLIEIYKDKGVVKENYETV